MKKILIIILLFNIVFLANSQVRRIGQTWQDGGTIATTEKNIGIGVSVPTVALEVSGTIIVDTIKIEDSVYIVETGQKNYIWSNTLNTLTSDNIIIGNNAFNATSTADNNVIIGDGAGSGLINPGVSNHFIGKNAGSGIGNGGANIMFGEYTGTLINGSYNIALGNGSMQGVGSVTNGINGNIAIGFNAMKILQNGSADYNNAFGYQAGYNNKTGANNVYIGTQSGYSSQNGSGNIMIGFQSGYNETDGNRLYIHNTNADSTSALIYGMLSDSCVMINDLLVLPPRAFPPINPAPTDGMIYVNSTDNHIYCYINGAWRQLDN